jgi:hypothetical protein
MKHDTRITPAEPIGDSGNEACGEWRDASDPHFSCSRVRQKLDILHTLYDPFLGSGTTLIAAEMSHRRCRAIETNPTYVDVAIERWQQLTDCTAKLMARAR